MSDSPIPRSATAMTDQLAMLTHSGASLIQIRTREPLRAAAALREHYLTAGTPYHEWSTSTGWRDFTLKNLTDNLLQGSQKDFVDALERPRKELTDAKSAVLSATDKIHVFAYIGPGPHLKDNPYVLDMLSQYAVALPTRNVVLLFITDDEALTDVPQGLLVSAEMRTPTLEELQEICTTLLARSAGDDSPFAKGHTLSDEDIQEVCQLGLGLAHNEFEQHIALAIMRAATDGVDTLTVEHVRTGIATGKMEVVRQSDILELMPAEDIGNVGGMQRLKDWIGQRADCYSAEAREFGIEPPKGMVLVGVPGAGKSLVAKSVAGVLRVPLIRLDFGRVFSKFVGDSEERVRRALRMVESMAPCVLFVDEIDKGLGGIGSGGDGGVSMRVLGTYLTWLQELKQPVFNLVTANRVNGLPPELLRRGRFDQIFSVVFPTPQERREILAIHLRRRGQDIAKFKEADIQNIVNASESFAASEIESAVKDGLILAFSASAKFSAQHVLTALRGLIPMSKSHAEQINSIVAWATDNAVSVSYTEEEAPGPAVRAIPAQRRIVTPTRK